MSKRFKFIPEEPSMLAEFQRIYGRKWVYITSPMPDVRKLEGLPGLHSIVWRDMDEITPDEFYRLVLFISSRFDAKPMAVSQRLTLDGLPLLLANGYVVVDDPKEWLHGNT